MPARRTALLAVWVLFVLLLPMAGDAAASGDDIVFVGGGLGHGVGLSQYGALGQAEEGREGEAIARHYYPGTRVVDVGGHPLEDPVLLSVERPLWVNLRRGAASATVTAIGAAATVTTSSGTATIGAGRTWTVTRDAQGCRWSEGATTQLVDGVCRADVVWPTGGRLRVDGIELADADVHLRAEGVAPGRFHISAALDLETYLRGVHEMPSWWPAAAQEAQAIVARTYAVWRFSQREVAGLRSGEDPGFTSYRKAMCWCHLYATTYDQRYQGWSWEADPAAAGWRAAVAATTGRILVYDGPDAASTTRAGVIAAFYGSSTFGRTSDNTAGLGSPSPYPYLASVEDRWSADPDRNPYARWERAVSTVRIAAALGWDAVTGVTLERPAPATLVRFFGRANGADVAVTKDGAWLRTALGLPSPQVIAVEGGSVAGTTTTTTTTATTVASTTTTTVPTTTSTVPTATTTVPTPTTTTTVPSTTTTTTTLRSTTTTAAITTTVPSTTTTVPATTTAAGSAPAPSPATTTTAMLASPTTTATTAAIVPDTESATGPRTTDGVDAPGSGPSGAEEGHGTPPVLFRIEPVLTGTSKGAEAQPTVAPPQVTLDDPGPRSEHSTPRTAGPTAGRREHRPTSASAHLAFAGGVGVATAIGEAAVRAVVASVGDRAASFVTAARGAAVGAGIAGPVAGGGWTAGLPTALVLAVSSVGLGRRLRRPPGRHRARRTRRRSR